MKPPSELGLRLARQWEDADLREDRLLNPDVWPVILGIGKPAASSFDADPGLLRAHLKAWREVQIGEVQWETMRFRKLSVPVDMPVSWILRKPTEWIAACNSPIVMAEFQRLSTLIDIAPILFHSVLIRQRHLWRDKSHDEIVQSINLALQLEPGTAQGAPLRALGLGGVDSKFFERNRLLLTRLLDLRFDGLPGEQGLAAFLDAAIEGDHWLLVVDLDGNLLPYSQLRVRDVELSYTALPGRFVLIIENEQCHHQLPKLVDTVAVLGGGLNLGWLKAEWLGSRQLAYWGDIDTWGLTMLARARALQPALVPLLMKKEVFDRYADRAVVEPVPAGDLPVMGLTEAEIDFYHYLLKQPRSRLEQEYLPKELVQQEITEWQALSSSSFSS